MWSVFYLLANRNSSTQVETSLTQRLESLSASRKGPWSVELDTWVNKEREFYQYALKSSGSSPFLLLGYRSFGDTASAHRFFRVDDHGLALLNKLQKNEQKISVYLKGVEYRLGDFIVRLGLVFEKTNPAVVVVKIQYLPFVDEKAAKKLCSDLMNHLCRSSVDSSMTASHSTEPRKEGIIGNKIKAADSIEKTQDSLDSKSFYEVSQEKPAQVSEAIADFLSVLSASPF